MSCFRQVSPNPCESFPAQAIADGANVFGVRRDGRIINNIYQEVVRARELESFSAQAFDSDVEELEPTGSELEVLPEASNLKMPEVRYYQYSSCVTHTWV